MASGIFPLDGVNPSIGRRLRTRDYDAAALRLMQFDDEIEKEKQLWRMKTLKERKRKLDGTSAKSEKSELDDSLNSGSHNGTERPVKGSLKPNKRAKLDDAHIEKTEKNKKRSSLEKEVKDNQNESLAPGLAIIGNVPVVTNFADMEPKARKAAIKRRKRKLRAIKQKAARLARMTDNQTNKIVKPLQVQKEKAKNKTGKRMAAHSEKSSPVKKGKIIHSDAMPNIEEEMKVSPTKPNIEDDAEVREQSNVLIESQETTNDVQYTVPNLVAVKDNAVIKGSFKKSTPKKEDRPRTEESPSNTEKLEQISPKALQIDTSSRQAASAENERNANQQLHQGSEQEKVTVMETALLPEVSPKEVSGPPKVPFVLEDFSHSVKLQKSTPSISPQWSIVNKSTDQSSHPPLTDAVSPSPKRKVELVTLWTPSQNTSPKGSVEMGLRRSARVFKNTPLGKQLEKPRRSTGIRRVAIKNRYYDEVAAGDLDRTDDLANSKPCTPDVAKAPTLKGSQVVQFEEFVKTPPAFFRLAVKKLSPKKTPSPAKVCPKELGTDTKSTAVKKAKEDIETKSAKKVNFSLTKNSSQGMRHYAMSLRSRPGIPFSADKLPVQGVLKASPPVKGRTTPMKRKV